MNAFETSRLKRILSFFAVAVLSAAAALLLIRLGILFAPFLLAFLIASLMEPVIRLLEKKARMGRKLTAPILLLIVIALAVFLASTAVAGLVSELKALSGKLPGLFTVWYGGFSGFLDSVRSGSTWIPSELADGARSLIGSLLNSFAGLAENIVKSLLSTAVSIPQVFVFILTTIMAAYFLSSGRPYISGIMARQLPASWHRQLDSFKTEVFSTLSGYLRATLILMGITFAILYAGFSFIRLEYSLLLAFLVALVDALPVVGTGTVLLPWALYCYITGNIPLGSSLLIIYAVALVVRQLAEPRIMGRQIGLNPLVTLASMYAGFQLAGFTGMIVGPVAVLFIKGILKRVYGNRTLKDLW